MGEAIGYCAFAAVVKMDKKNGRNPSEQNSAGRMGGLKCDMVCEFFATKQGQEHHHVITQILPKEKMFLSESRLA